MSKQVKKQNKLKNILQSKRIPIAKPVKIFKPKILYNRKKLKMELKEDLGE